MQNKIKVMVIDDSAVFRALLVTNIGNDPRFEVVGYAVDAMDADRKIQLLKPDILTLDIEMPGMSGLDFLKELLPRNPLPVILVSSLNIRVFDALSAGAVDFVQKPDMSSTNRKEMFISTLLNKLFIASKAHVMPKKPTAPGTPAPAAPPVVNTHTTTGRQILSGIASSDPQTLIAIGASTGGTEATLEILRRFPAQMPGIVITQHMPAGFTSMYAERLNRLCKIEVREAQNGDKVRPGLALLAPGGLQMRIARMGNGYAVNCTEGEKVSGHRPSVDALFDSVAIHARNKAIGVILTGMGADGAAGLLRMRKNGAYTIGQDKDSCVVYGMPMEAYKIGAVCTQAPLSGIAQVVMQRLSKS